MFRNNSMFNRYLNQLPITKTEQQINTKNETKIIETKKPQEIKQEIKQIIEDIKPKEDKILDKNEFYDFLNLKFSKIDEALLQYIFFNKLYRFKQERLPTKLEEMNEDDEQIKLNTKRQREKYEIKEDIKKQEIKEEIKKQEINEDKNIEEKKEIKHRKAKKSFGNVDDVLFEKVKEKYPSLPDDKKELIVVDNDGNFFISKNKKKLPLNNVNALKLINNKK
jgi:hypothetical protein